MSKAIKLKVKQSRLPLVGEALLQYADLCTIATSTQDFFRAEDYNIRLSVAMEIYYKIQERLSKRYPAETFKIPLEYHHALVLQTALLRFVSTSNNDFERNAIDIIKNELNALIAAQSTVTS